MKSRTTISISLLVFVALLPMAVAADEGAPLGLSWEAGYVGACLAESGLSLSDETPLAALEARPSSGVSYDDGADTKNPMVALLLSCVVPGWGEIYVGETTRGRWFMAAEAGIWAGYGAFKIQEGMREDDYRDYAQIFAGTAPGADSSYLSDMGGYIRSEGDDSYNESIRREARSLFPDDLEAQAAYLTENGYSGDLSWDWGTTDRFYEYRDLRRIASEAERNAFYITGLAVLNRVLSAVDSAWMARRHNAGVRGEPVARLSVVPQIYGGEVGARATLEMSF